MDAAKLLSRKVGPLPVYGWAAGSMLVIYLGYRYYASQQVEEISEEDTSLEGGGVDAAAGTGDAAFLYHPNSPGFMAGKQIYGDGPTDLGGTLPGAVPSIVVTTGDGTVAIPQTGGGPPETPARNASNVPAGWTKGNKLYGRTFPGVIAHHGVKRGKNSNGDYRQYETITSGGKKQKWNYYTSGRLKGKWKGPF